MERRLEISRDAYRKVLSDHSDKLKQLSKKLGKCITRTRPYNELKQKQVCYRKEIQLAAVKYENAISTLNTAQICVFESGVRDSNTLEALNQAITKVSNILLFLLYIFHTQPTSLWSSQQPYNRCGSLLELSSKKLLIK
ncbi:unnamed protein product [Trichobilharzia regenti]|nr:unnamed protein product [Trichobilharzia regenti]